MKNFLIYILLSLSSYSVFACGFSPYGEDLRFRMLNPLAYHFSDYQTFFYNANTFGETAIESFDYDSNVKDWYAFLNKKVPMEDIQTFLYYQSFTDIDESSSNRFVRYLYAAKKTNVLDYLKWAKTCEYFTSESNNDSWERNTDKDKISRSNYLADLQQKIKTEKNNYLQRRYAFLIIRLAYYNNDYTTLKNIYKTYFSSSKKDFLYYWSLYFYCFTNEATSMDMANVMAYSPEKRHAIFFHLRNKYSLADALKNAKTNEERANAYGFLSMQNLNYSLETMKKMYQLFPKNEQLDFLLLREISKLEDWIYTPYYTFNTPSVDRFYKEGGDDNFNYKNYLATYNQLIKKGELRDRAYAKELLQFVQSSDLSKVNDKMLWQSALVQLQFMTQDFNACIQSADHFIRTYPKELATKEIQKIRILATIARQNSGAAVIPETIQSFISNHVKDGYFMFALARELEYKGNLPDAIALISSINKEGRLMEGYDAPYFMNWWIQQPKGKGVIKWFWNYFPYIDYLYSPEQLKTILAKIESPKSKFETEIYSQLVHDKNYLYDMLGMKYIRQNKLEEALTVYKEMDQSYWKNNYSSWERDEYDGGYYAFDQNPFYQIKNTPDFVRPKERVEMTKPAILERLIQYLAKAEDKKNPNRAKYSFYVATCYFNMGQHGNAWMMRRFSSTYYFYQDEDEYENEFYEDEKEYRYNLMAQKYYHLAYEMARTDKFKALSLRMEEYAKTLGTESEYIYSKTLKQFPQYSKDLSACENLNAYFE